MLRHPCKRHPDLKKKWIEIYSRRVKFFPKIIKITDAHEINLSFGHVLLKSSLVR